MKLENLKHLQLFILPGYDILFKEETDKLIENVRMLHWITVLHIILQ